MVGGLGRMYLQSSLLSVSTHGKIPTSRGLFVCADSQQKGCCQCEQTNSEKGRARLWCQKDFCCTWNRICKNRCSSLSTSSTDSFSCSNLFGPCIGSNSEYSCCKCDYTSQTTPRQESQNCMQWAPGRLYSQCKIRPHFRNTPLLSHNAKKLLKKVASLNLWKKNPMLILPLFVLLKRKSSPTVGKQTVPSNLQTVNYTKLEWSTQSFCIMWKTHACLIPLLYMDTPTPTTPMREEALSEKRHLHSKLAPPKTQIWDFRRKTGKRKNKKACHR